LNYITNLTILKGVDMVQIVEQIAQEFRKDLVFESRSFPKKRVDECIKFINPWEAVVEIGIGFFSEYVNKINELFKNGVNKVTLKAKKRITCKAIDIAEIVNGAMEGKVRTKSIVVCSEYDEKEGNKVRYSTIEIILTRQF